MISYLRNRWPNIDHIRQFLDSAKDAPGRYRELRTLLADVAEIEWWHPAWWGLVAGTALFESFGPDVAVEDLYALFMSADGGPHIDTFMGRKAQCGELGTPARIARAVVRARAAQDALTALEGKLPRQPLCCSLEWENGWLRRRQLGDLRSVAFLTPRGPRLAQLEPGRELEVARSIAADRLQPIDMASREQTPAAIAVSLLDAPLALASHLHRQLWTHGGGPWLGVGGAPPYEIATTCHLVVDGYGHWLITAELFRRLDALAELEVTLARDPHLRNAQVTNGAYQWHDTRSASVADVVVDGRVRFAESAYAFGRALSHIYQTDSERRRARYSPTFQVPVAPHSPAGDDRRLRRIVHGLMALHIADGQFESFSSFCDRLPAVLEREMRGMGFLTRLMQAAARAPVPHALRRRYLGSPTRPSRWLPPTAVLAGRGCLSSLRLANDARATEPLYAVSAPPLGASRHDPRGAAILTLMHYDDYVTVTASGSGLTANSDGAARVLHTWLEELDRLRLDRGSERASRATPHDIWQARGW